MHKLALICLIYAPLVLSAINDPDYNRTIEQLIESRGFKWEKHYVKTKDDYILGTFRIVNPTLKQFGKPIILQHGLLSSSFDLLVNSESKCQKCINPQNETYSNSLALALSSVGYDVWLPNSRGNTYSKNHTYLDPKKNQFWEFTFDEMIKYDLPASIKYIQNHTGYEQIAYVGHSQGTQIMFGLLSDQPEYSKIIKPFIALAPVTTISHIKGLIPILLRSKTFSTFLKLKRGELLSNNPVLSYMTKKLCRKPVNFACDCILQYLFGVHTYNIDRNKLPVFLHHAPSGTSSLNILHFIQIFQSKKFRKFDYGRYENMKRYGQITPPEYLLEKINSSDIAILYSDIDYLSDLIDVNILLKKLKVPPKLNYYLKGLHWGHVDFIWAKQTGKIINVPLEKFLAQYSESDKNIIDNQL